MLQFFVDFSDFFNGVKNNTSAFSSYEVLRISCSHQTSTHLVLLRGFVMSRIVFVHDSHHSIMHSLLSREKSVHAVDAELFFVVVVEVSSFSLIQVPE